MVLILKKQLKDWFRNRITSLQFGVGDELMHIYRRLFGRRKKIYTEKKEANRILYKVKGGKLKKALVVYDCLSSPPTYGDFLCTVMLARYFASQGIFTYFLILNGEYRGDWSNFKEDDIRQRVDQHLKLAKTLLNYKSMSVDTLNWKQFKERLNKGFYCEKDIIFRKNVLSRSVVYAHSLNTLNHLCYNSSPILLKNFLLTDDDFSKNTIFKTVLQPYITYHCRRSEKSTSLFRNTQDDEFIQVYFRLRELYPNHKILVLSDMVGYKYFKNLSEKNNFECLFSKEYSDSFFGDCRLLLGGSYHFTLRGGGIDMISIFSESPYEQFATPINDYMLDNGKATSWSTPAQFYTDIKGAPDIFLPSGNIKEHSL
jgi:hypothetical protein